MAYIFYVSSIHTILRQLCKQFIPPPPSLSQSLFVCQLHYDVHSDQYFTPRQCSYACLPHLPLVCGSGGMCMHTCIYASSRITVCSKERSSKITLHCGVKADRDTHLQSSRQHAWNDKPMQQSHSGDFIMWKGPCPFALAQHTEKFGILPNVSSLCSSSVVVTQNQLRSQIYTEWSG